MEEAQWPEALATVTECKYDFGAGRALAFGIPLSKHFRISYNYFADNDLHYGQFSSATAVPQGHLFPVRYNPHAPHEHSHDAASAPQRTGTPIFMIGVVGSVLLSFAWFVVLRGCH